MEQLLRDCYCMFEQTLNESMINVLYSTLVDSLKLITSTWHSPVGRRATVPLMRREASGTNNV